MIGITERGDAAINLDWIDWVSSGAPAILITKNPTKLASLITSTMNIIVHCTITGYGGSILEPNVPKPVQAIEGYNKIIDKIGAERVVLRVDPIIVTPKGIDRAESIILAAVTRVRISFLDMYDHVKERFTKHGIALPYTTLHASLKQRNNALIRLQACLSMIPIDVCGEPGMKCSGCVSKKDCMILGVTPTQVTSIQRKYCACLSLKKELLSNKHPCLHGCLYCYWRN